MAKCLFQCIVLGVLFRRHFVHGQNLQFTRFRKKKTNGKLRSKPVNIKWIKFCQNMLNAENKCGELSELHAFHGFIFEKEKSHHRPHSYASHPRRTVALATRLTPKVKAPIRRSQL